VRGALQAFSFADEEVLQIFLRFQDSLRFSQHVRVLGCRFLIVLFVKSESDGNRSGGFSQSYYDKSVKRGRGTGGKITNEAAIMKGKGTGMYSDS